MFCPDCGYDNIEGVDVCDGCGQPLTNAETDENQLDEVVSRHSVDLICEKEALSIGANATVREAVTLMVDRRVGCLLVTDDDGCLVGVFTERDVLNRVSEDLTRLDQPISSFMTANPEVVMKRDSIAYALHQMDVGGYRHIPMVNSQRHPRGIISIRDIMRFICIRFADLRA